MSRLPDIPLSAEAQRLLTHIRPVIMEGLDEVNKVPVSGLLWGSGIDSASNSLFRLNPGCSSMWSRVSF